MVTTNDSGTATRTPPAEPAALTLTDFLLARIAEDEAAAGLIHHRDCGCRLRPNPADCSCAVRPRLLADCAAKRKLVERHRSSADTRGVGQHRDGRWTPYCEYESESWPCPDIADLAAVYADHADYRDEWRSHTPALSTGAPTA